MVKYEPQQFSIPALEGISEKTITEHLKLYEGYVKHVNLIHEKIDELSQDAEKHAYALGELQRRLGFEFGGMRNHEHYFGAFEGGAHELGDGDLKQAIAAQWGSFDAWLTRFKAIATTRGIGWAMLYLDPKSSALIETWVDEQHLGHLVECRIVLALDMWEHSYVMDFAPSGKKDYVEAFFRNLNWEKIEDAYRVART